MPESYRDCSPHPESEGDKGYGHERLAGPMLSLAMHPRRPLRRLTLAFALVVSQAVAGPPLPPAASQAAPAGTAGINRPEQIAKPYVILISFDGLRADYLDRFALPNFQRVLRRGTRAAGMIPVFPSLTFPNHYSLVTGLHPENHGIVGNNFYDPQRKDSYNFRDTKDVGDGSWYRGEPIWVTAESQGMVAACFFFPGSEAAINGVRPTFWKAYDGSVPNRTRVATVLEWLRLPEERRPHVMTLYFSDVDSAAHLGPLDAPAVGRAASALDEALGQLVDGIAALPHRDRVYLILTSDHGMVETSATQTVLLSSLIDPSAVRVGFAGPVASLHVNGGPREAEQVRDQLNARLKNGRAYLRADLPERHHYRADPRIGDVVVIMDESWTIASTPLEKLRFWEPWGQHGWDPAYQSMRAIFAIAGPGVREGATIPDIDNVDVYPLMTELLGLRPPDRVDGRAGRLRQLVMQQF